ncbi:TIGR00266 family protein [Sulfolobus sp. E5-1-F]|uniref:TIGR00266 family protein n=1 Tax=Saccharolobus sp. E5-1-F TaxID=2663019 RepID=UPI001295BA50|nr:TIGR00266 family protein [Sulfolobus sp. E5-1-F]QGA54024.1 TIGR00266 family protein [Sulfolobus sp. E5-1-F]
MPQYEILGNDLQYLKVILGDGESIYADAGHILAKGASVNLQTKLKGGFFGGLKRLITGGTFFVTELYGPGEVYLSTIFPGKVIQIPLEGGTILAEAHSFLAAENTINYDSQLAKLSVGWLGGEGLFLAKFNGVGNLFMHSYGEAIVKDLAPGETMQIEASHLLAFQSGMNYNIETVGGLRSILFAHEGIFFVRIQGPGRVWLHSLTAQQLASVLAPYLPKVEQG